MDRRCFTKKGIEDRRLSFRLWNAIVNAILIAAALFTLARMAWILDTQDITVKWTEDDKKIATERVAN